MDVRQHHATVAPARPVPQDRPDSGPAMRARLSNVLLAVPTFNEEVGLPSVLDESRRLGVATVVVDGGSADRTVAVANRYDIPVVTVSRGKGRGWRDFLSSYPYRDWEYVAMVDGDATYDLSALPRLLAPKADMAVGIRLSRNGETPRVRAMGARALSLLAGWVTTAHCPDLLSGFRVMRSDTLGQVRLTSDRFGLETELTIEYIRRGLRGAWVPVGYGRRSGESKLNPLSDGVDVLGTILRTRYRRR